MDKKNLYKPQNFINRELSWLEFNDRVLQEARNRFNPFFERIKFLSIVSSNLDEFFMVRVAGLKDQVAVGYHKADPSGLTPKQQLEKISDRTHKMVKDQYQSLNRSIIPRLRRNGIRIVYRRDLTDKQRTYLEEYFTNTVYPVLTPMAVDSSRPFPLITNKSLNIGVLIENRENMQNTVMFATVQVPGGLARLVEIPSIDGMRCFIFLEEIIMMYLERLFTGRKIVCAHLYRITRNADLTLEEDEAEDLLLQIEKSLKKRKWGAAVRLEIERETDERLVKILKNALEILDSDIYFIPGPLDLTLFMKIYAEEGYEHLKYPEHTPQIPEDLIGEEDIFSAASKKDILVHHPYEAFDPIIDFIRAAVADRNVLAIKQTLYRVSGDSSIVKALTEAAENGKQVTVLVELKARFDEENNIQWAKRLEHAGCHVIYGLVGLKTHCKIILIVRKESDGIKRYVHLGTGNYNDITANFYTDIGLITSNEYFGADASAAFNMLSGYSRPPEWYKVEAAPLGLRERFLELIENEIKHSLAGREARIIAKMNSLVDPEIIVALYKASGAGVKIHLIVRGICCLKPGLPHISENIKVHSIVGRFLEHSRIYYFYNDGREEVFLSSADLMQRNLDRRVELLFPVEDTALKKRIFHILTTTLNDNVKTRVMNSDGKYKKIDRRGKIPLNSQEYFYNLAVEKVKKYNEEKDSPVFEPITYGIEE